MEAATRKRQTKDNTKWFEAIEQGNNKVEVEVGVQVVEVRRLIRPRQVVAEYDTSRLAALQTILRGPGNIVKRS